MMDTLRRERLVGELVEAYVDWRVSCALAARAAAAMGTEIHLTPIEFRLLTVLIQNRGRLLTHNALLRHVWGPAYTDARQTLRAHMANLRRKIEPADGGPLIHTDRGVGYRLADMHPEAAEPGRSAD